MGELEIVMMLIIKISVVIFEYDRLYILRSRRLLRLFESDTYFRFMAISQYWMLLLLYDPFSMGGPFNRIGMVLLEGRISKLHNIIGDQ